MKNKVRWDHLNRVEIKELAEKDAIIILPLGATEQHGPHLPVGCDAILATAMSEKIAEEIQKRGKACVVTPTLSMANSMHHMSFAGTISVTPQSYIPYLTDICKAIASHGFKKIIIINGHGGNKAPTDSALVNICPELGFPVYFAGYWQAAPTIQAEVLEKQKNMRHACESETSIMLAINEDLVDPIYLETEGATSYANPYEEKGFVGTFHKWHTNTPNGVLGMPYAATKEKGEKMVKAMVEGMADVLCDDALWAVPL